MWMIYFLVLKTLSRHHCHHVFSRNIPDMTVKALAFCLAITTFSAVTTGASWSRPPSSWTGFRAVRRCVGFRCCGILPTHCPPTIWKVRHAVSCRGTRLLPPLWNFLTPEGTACVLCHSGIALCSSGLSHGLRYYHVPGKDASVKCFDAVLGKVHLPCLRFVVVRHGPSVVFWHPFSLSVSAACFLKIQHFWLSDDTQKDSSWLPLVPSSTKAPINSTWRNGEICQVLSTEAFTSFCQACDGTMGSSLPRHHCFFASTRCGRLYFSSSSFYSSCSCFAHAIVCLMFPVFWAWHCVFHVPVCCSHRDSLTRWRLARRKPRVLLLLCLLICSLNHDVPCEFWQLARDFSLRDVDERRSCFHRSFVSHALCYLSPFSVTVLDKMIGIRLDALTNYFVLVLWMLPSRIGGERFSRTSWKNTLCCDMSYKRALFSSQFSFGILFVFCDWISSMSGWVCHWKPFWIPVGESFQKAHLEEWIPMGDDSSGQQCMANIPTMVQGAGYKD